MRKQRRYLKDLDAHPDDFDYGRKRSDVMNEPKKSRNDSLTDRTPQQ